MALRRKAAIGAAAAAIAAAIAGLVFRRRSLPTVQKGVFIEYALFDAPAAALRKMGITWVMVQTAIMKPGKDKWVDRDREALERLAARLNPPGSPYQIEIWGWGWPQPDRAEAYAAHVREVLASPSVAGYCLNIEVKAWSTKTNGEFRMELLARTLISEIRKGASKPITLSSHGRADLVPLPWEALRLLDGALPQCYDKDGLKEPGFVKRCIDSYSELGFTTVIPTLGAVKTEAVNMQKQLDDLPPGLGALSWWSWTQIGRSESRASVIEGCCTPGKDTL